MADFSVESKFNPQANFQSVKFGADTNLLEVELNEMQQIQTEARAELVRQATPSGFISLSELDYTYMAANPNTIRFLNDSIAFVHGYQVTIPAGTIMPLSAPPTEGSREDLAFLEVWIEEVDYTKPINKYGVDGQGTIPNTLKDDRIGVETSRRIQLKCRLRVVDGVDFNSYDLDGMSSSAYWWREDHKILAQGGNSEPPRFDANIDGMHQLYRNSKLSFQDIKVFGDRGLFVVGKGNQASKNVLKTADGYVYAVPMFRISRRNSGGYSVNNGNGANSYYMVSFANRTALVINARGTWNLSNIVDYNKVNVGDYLMIQGSGHVIRVVSKDDATTYAVTVENLSGAGTTTGTGSANYNFIGNRPDLLLSDIVAERDIKPLWHQISLTGFNTQQLLEENFDKLLRGELQTKEKMQMVKTYHGVRKTPIDSNTIFYASMDGSVNAEVGGAPTKVSGSTQFVPTITGLGVASESNLMYPIAINSDAITVDLIVDFSKINSYVGKCPSFLWFADSNEQDLSDILYYRSESNTLVCEGKYALGQLVSTLCPNSGIHHIRFVHYFDKAKGKIYIDGKLKGDGIPNPNGIYDKTKVAYLCLNKTVMGLNTKCSIADLSISNIDRGDVFATLPKDFIDGYARIAPAFNSQRKVFSDALTSQYTSDMVKASGVNAKQIATTQKTPGVWTAGDTIKVRGLGGEIISGVIDSDTALARVTQDGTFSANTICVDDISRLAVNDTFAYVSGLGSLEGTHTITTIDSTNKIVTFTPALNGWQPFAGHILVETTASSSSPTVKFNNAGTITAVTGTWSGLGTNEATFTLGTTTGLNAQDLQVEYSLNMTAGQGGISEVLTATLAGEYQGKKLVINPSVHIRDDFAGKKAGSTIECPHELKIASGMSELLTPSSSSWWSGLTQDHIDPIKALDTKILCVTSNEKGKMPQACLQFNIVREVEDRFGPIPALDKIAWCRANIAKITLNAYVYGSCPTGTKVYIASYLTDWAGYILNNSSSSPTLIAMSTDNMNRILADGVMSFLVYTDPAKTTDGYVLALSNHGLSVGDIVKDTTKGDIIQQIYYTTKDSIAVSNPSSSVTAGDSLNKYHSIGRKTAEVGTNANTIIISNHGLSTGDCIGNNTTGNIRVVTVVDANTLTVTSPVPNQASGDSVSLLKFVGTQIAEDTVIPSQINLDYAYLDITLKTPAGYDILAPENPRRDDGRANMLLVRKETKEVQTMFSAKNDDGIVTWADYVPYQGLSRIDNGRYKVLAVSRGMITTNGTGKAYTVTKDYPLPVISQLPTNNLDSELSSEPIDTVYTATTSARVITYMINDLILESAGDNLWSGVSKPVANRYIGLSGVKQAYRGLLRGASNVLNSIACDLLKPATHKCFASVLIILDSELVLLVYGSTLRNGTINFFDMDTLDIFKLSNRPLIK